MVAMALLYEEQDMRYPEDLSFLRIFFSNEQNDTCHSVFRSTPLTAAHTTLNIKIWPSSKKKGKKEKHTTRPPLTQ